MPNDFSGDPSLNDDIGFLTLVGALWHGKLVILSAMIFTLGLTAFYAFGVAVPSYRASAQMSLSVRTENMANLDSVLSGVSPDQSSINTEMAVIKSGEILGRLVDGLNLIEDPEFNPVLRPPSVLNRAKAALKNLAGTMPASQPDDQTIRDMVIDQARAAITVLAQDKSFVFTISATTQSPTKSARIANTLAQYYRDDQIALKVDATEKAAVWLAERVAELQVEIEAAEKSINALRTRNTLITAEGIAALNAQSVAVAADLQAAELTLSRAQDRLAIHESSIPADFSTRAKLSGDAQLISLADEAAHDNSTAVMRFDRRFDQLLMQLRGEAARAQEAVRDLRQQSDTITDQFEQQSQALIEIEQTDRETEATRILYETFLTRLKETTVQVGVHQADSRLLSAATSGYQVAPRKGILLALSLVLGFILGALALSLRAALQNTYRTTDDLERRTGRAVLGQIPTIAGRSGVGTIEYLCEKPASAAAEAVRSLRTSILMSHVDRACQVILSTSSVPGEGKTTLAIALAQNLAGLNKRVILIEGDIRRRKFSTYFPQACHRPGLLSVLSGQAALDDAIWPHPSANIHVLMGQKSVVNAADVLSSDSFAALMVDLRQSYDYIIIDTPPVMVVPDARIISTVADAIFYVVRWDRTTRTQVDEGLKQLRNAQAPITGLVLSQIDPKAMQRYGYGGQNNAYAAEYYEA